MADTANPATEIDVLQQFTDISVAADSIKEVLQKGLRADNYYDLVRLANPHTIFDSFGVSRGEYSNVNKFTKAINRLKPVRDPHLITYI